MVVRILAALVLLFCLGCSEELQPMPADAGEFNSDGNCTPATPTANSGATMELGRGITSFESMDDGVLPLIRGPQGFDMVFPAIRATNIQPGDPFDPRADGNPKVCVVVTLNQTELSNNLYTRGFEDDGSGRLVVAGLANILDVDRQNEYTNQTATVTVSLEDSTGIALRETRVVSLEK